MQKNDLLKKTGHIAQLAGIRSFQFSDGRSKGTTGFEVYNQAGLRFTVLADKCLDLFDLSYRGVNFSFQAKTGLVGNQHFNALDNEFSYYWNAGMFYTCGLANTGPPCTENGLYRTEHGRIGMTPAENICARSYWENDDYVMSISGDVNEAIVCGPALRLKRQIRTTLESKEVCIRDTIENLEPADEEIMMLYHVNFGYPLLDVGSRVVKPTGRITARFPECEPFIDDCLDMAGPVDGLDEQVFFHENKADEQGYAYVAVINEKLALGAYLKYSMETLPVLVQWKNMRSHDYTLGLEPSNSFIRGRKDEKENGTLQKVAGYGHLDYEVILGVLDGQEEISQFINRMKSL